MKKIIKFLLSALQVQLFLNIISLIIIAHWGLPISYVAPLSNIIFSPFLTLFLLFSSLIFFCELTFIPNAWLIFLLELLTHTWSRIMLIADSSWTFSVTKPSIFITIGVLGSSFLILQCKQLKYPLRRILAFTILLVFLIVYLKYTQQPEYAVHTFTLNKKELKVISTKESLLLLDHGALSQIGCTRAWLEFTLLPFLRQNYGKDIVSHLITLRPTVKSLTIMNELCTITPVKNMYISYWHGETPHNFIKAFMILKENLQKNSALHRISKKNIFIPLGLKSYIEIIPTKEQITYQSMHFQTAHISCILASQSIPIMPENREILNANN